MTVLSFILTSSVKNKPYQKAKQLELSLYVKESNTSGLPIISPNPTLAA
ncbi:hypothetical protein ACFSWD_12035 [Paenibacillus xanthanilyticus]